MNQESFKSEINSEAIQEKINEYAYKGAIQAVEEFYTSYNSPYKKEITKQLEGKGVKGIEIPDIIGRINESISKEVDAIANNAVVKSYIPHLKEFLTRAPSEINFSEILEEFIKIEFDSYYSEDLDTDDFEVDVEKHEKFDWYKVSISSENKNYEFTLHEQYYVPSVRQKKEEEGAKKEYRILSLPTHKEDRGTSSFGLNKKMTIKLEEGASLEMPFEMDIIRDRFMSFMAKLIISGTKITLDTTEIDEYMFPEDDGCHC